jgi:hypothetical protein
LPCILKRYRRLNCWTEVIMMSVKSSILALSLVALLPLAAEARPHDIPSQAQGHAYGHAKPLHVVKKVKHRKRVYELRHQYNSRYQYDHRYYWNGSRWVLRARYR